MTTLTLNKIHTHTPNMGAISTIVEDSEFVNQFTFCEDCEQNIERLSWYDEDRGYTWSKWAVSN